MSLRTGGKGHVTPIHTLPHHVILGESNTRVCSGIAWIYLGILGYSRVFLGILGYFWVFSGILGYSWVFLVIAWLLLGHARVWLGYYSGDFLLQITGCPLPHALSHTQTIVTAASKMRVFKLDSVTVMDQWTDGQTKPIIQLRVRK